MVSPRVDCWTNICFSSVQYLDNMQILSTCKTYPANESFPESVCSTQEKYKIHFKQMEEKYQILKSMT